MRVNFELLLELSNGLLFRWPFWTVLDIAVLECIEFPEPDLVAEFDPFQVLPEFAELLAELVAGVGHHVLHEIPHHEVLPF